MIKQSCLIAFLTDLVWLIVGQWKDTIWVCQTIWVCEISISPSYFMKLGFG